MDIHTLKMKKCIPCEGGVVAYTKEQAENMLGQINGWSLAEHNTQTGAVLSIKKTIYFKGFKAALGFVNEVGDIAEFEGHHPDLYIHNWNQLTITFSTHSINGLSENDFIMATKVNQLIIDAEISEPVQP